MWVHFSYFLSRLSDWISKITFSVSWNILRIWNWLLFTDPGCNGGTVIDNPDILLSLVSIDCSARWGLTRSGALLASHWPSRAHTALWLANVIGQCGIAGKLMWIDVFYHVNFAFQLSGKICEQNLTACWAVNSEACGEICPASDWLMGASPALSLAADTLTPLHCLTISAHKQTNNTKFNFTIHTTDFMVPEYRV